MRTGGISSTGPSRWRIRWVYDAPSLFGGVFQPVCGRQSYATKADNDLIDVLVPENLRDYFRKTRIEVPDLHRPAGRRSARWKKFSVMYPQSGAAGRGLARRAGRLPGRRGHHQAWAATSN